MEQLSIKVANGGATDDGKLKNTDWNQAAEEIESAILASGSALSGANLTQLIQSIARMAQGYAFWGTDGGAANTYVVSSLSGVYTNLLLFSGMTVKFRPANNSSSTTPTLNAFGTGVRTIVNEAGAPLVSGDLSTTRDAEVRYDGTNWRLLTRSLGVISAAILKKGYINGYYIQPGADVDHDITVLGGDAANTLGDFNLIVFGLLTKQIDATWVAGNNAGGRPAAVALSNNTWYRVFVIGGASASTDVGFDTSITATNLLNTATSVSGTTYNKYRQIGWVLTDGSANIIPFHMNLDNFNEVKWQTPIENIQDTDPVNTRLTVTVSAPPASNALLHVWAGANPSATRHYVMDVRPTTMPDITPSRSVCVLRGDEFGDSAFSNSIQMEIYADGSSQIAYRFQELVTNNLSSVKYNITTHGFVYRRGVL